MNVGIVLPVLVNNASSSDAIWELERELQLRLSLSSHHQLQLEEHPNPDNLQMLMRPVSAKSGWFGLKLGQGGRGTGLISLAE